MKLTIGEVENPEGWVCDRERMVLDNFGYLPHDAISRLKPTLASLPGSRLVTRGFEPPAG